MCSDPRKTIPVNAFNLNCEKFLFPVKMKIVFYKPSFGLISPFSILKLHFSQENETEFILLFDFTKCPKFFINQIDYNEINFQPSVVLCFLRNPSYFSPIISKFSEGEQSLF